jgi:hypothetical protein
MKPETRESNISTADFVAVGGNRERIEERNNVRAENSAGAARAAEPSSDERSTPLFDSGEGERFRTHWTEIQTAFVDEPREAVKQADGLVAEVIQRLARSFADERAKMEHEWSRSDDGVSTEDLRIALRRYRSFFDRLLSV